MDINNAMKSDLDRFLSESFYHNSSTVDFHGNLLIKNLAGKILNQFLDSPSADLRTYELKISKLEEEIYYLSQQNENLESELKLAQSVNLHEVKFQNLEQIHITNFFKISTIQFDLLIFTQKKEISNSRLKTQELKNNLNISGKKITAPVKKTTVTNNTNNVNNKKLNGALMDDRKRLDLLNQRKAVHAKAYIESMK